MTLKIISAIKTSQISRNLTATENLPHHTYCCIGFEVLLKVIYSHIHRKHKLQHSISSDQANAYNWITTLFQNFLMVQ